MVFNPTFQGGIQFEQPVAPAPSPISAVGNILTGLGVLGGGQGQPSNADTRFNNAVRQYAEQTGITTPFTEWTTAQRRGFAQFSPAHSNDLEAAYQEALQSREQAGETTEQFRLRQQRDMVAEWGQTPEGVSAMDAAITLYPEDRESQLAFFERQFLQFNLDEAERNRIIRESEDLSRDATDATSRRTIQTQISERFWETHEASLRQDAATYARAMPALAERIASGEEVMSSSIQITPGTTLADYLGYDVRVSNRNIRVIFNDFIQSRIGQILEDVEGVGVNAPSPEYLTNVFAPLQSMVDLMHTDTDPVRLAAIAEAHDELARTGSMPEATRHAIRMVERFAGDPVIMQALRETPGFSEALSQVGNLFVGTMATGVPIPPEEADALSVEEASQTMRSILDALDAAQSPTPEAAEGLGAGLASMQGLLERTNQRIDPQLYGLLLGDAARAVYQNPINGEEARESISQIIQFDMGQDIERLREFAEQNGGELSFENGRFVYNGAALEDPVTGEVLTESRPLTGRQAALLEEVNSQLEALDDYGSELFGAEPAEIFGTTVEGTNPDRGVTSERGPSIGTTPESERRPPPRADDLPEGVDPYTGGNFSLDAPFESRTYDSHHDYVSFRDSLSFTESRGDFTASNSEDAMPGVVNGQRLTQGHYGRQQWSPGRLQEAIEAGVMPANMSIQELLHTDRGHRIQEAIEAWSYDDHLTFIEDNNLDRFIGQNVGGVMITMEGMIAAAHLGGQTGMRRWLESGGSSNPRDVYGTSLAQYAARHGRVFDPQEFTAPSGSTRATGYRGVFTSNSMNPLFTMEGASHMTSPHAAEAMDALLRGPYARLTSSLPFPLVINDAIARAGTSREHNTPGSQHFQGRAIDISLAGLDDNQRLALVRAAHAAGFTGFGFGRNILHIDLGPARSWNYSSGSDTFAGGFTNAQMAEMVAGGNFDAAVEAGGYYGRSPSQATLDRFAEARMDLDPRQGPATDLRVYDDSEVTGESATVEQPESEDGVTRATQPSRGSRGRAVTEGTVESAPVSSDIQDLVEGLTEDQNESD